MSRYHRPDAATRHLDPPREYEGVELTEVVDGHDRPLAVMPLPEVHKQSLPHRAVLVLVYDGEGRLYLQKRALSKSLYPGCWDLSATGHVQVGEAREVAARRELMEELGLEAPRLELWRSLNAGPETGWEHVTLFNAGLARQRPRPNPEEVSEGMFVDRTEFELLLQEFRELCTPAMVYFGERGLLFPAKG